MYFDFEELRPDTPRIDSPISKREAILLSIILHGLAALIILLVPPVDEEARLEAIQRAEVLALARQQQALDDEPQRFVFVQPLVDVPAPEPPQRAELSDIDRRAQALEQAPEPANPLPFSRGDSSERVIAEEPAPVGEPVLDMPPDRPADAPFEEELAEGDEDGTIEGGPDTGPEAEGQLASIFPDGRTGPDGRLSPESPDAPSRDLTGNSLGDALRNLQRYIDRQSFSNPQGGGGRLGSMIDFDTMGVEFGPWVRRFVAQVRSNWIVPRAVWAFHGRVVMTFNVHKDGRITDLAVQIPSSIDGFNVSSYNALAGSNPTYPLPPEYPADQAFFTVTFLYNEAP